MNHRMKDFIDAAQDSLLAAISQTDPPLQKELQIILEALDCLYDTPASSPALVKFANTLCKLIAVEDDRGNEP